MQKPAPDFVFPPMYSFPPFFTLQPAADTRERQLQMWCELVLSYCSHHKIDQLDFDSSTLQRSPLFCNEGLSRRLKPEVMRMVVGRLADSGRAEWVKGSAQSKCLVFYKPPEQWADLIYKWATEHGFIDTVVTAYEIQHGDLAQEQDFFGLDANMILRALRVLEKRGKAHIFSGSEGEEQGVKFSR